MPKPKKQIAALPIRWNKKGKIRVLLVTSRETRRWVMPKGWPMAGKKPWRAAEIEALEEAGVKGEISPLAIGKYHYKKRLADGSSVICRVKLYPMHVSEVRKKWPERDQRKRRWFSLKAAARAVKEPELTDLLKKISKKPKKVPEIIELKKAA